MTGWMDDWRQGNGIAAEQPVQCVIISFFQAQWEAPPADGVGPLLSGHSLTRAEHPGPCGQTAVSAVVSQQKLQNGG